MSEEIQFSNHALRRMFERSISPESVLDALENGNTIKSYPEDAPYPSQLILHWAKDAPLHVLISEDPMSKIVYIITAYEPDPEKWNDTFTERINE